MLQVSSSSGIQKSVAINNNKESLEIKGESLIPKGRLEKQIWTFFLRGVNLGP